MRLNVSMHVRGQEYSVGARSYRARNPNHWSLIFNPLRTNVAELVVAGRVFSVSWHNLTKEERFGCTRCGKYDGGAP